MRPRTANVAFDTNSTSTRPVCDVGGCFNSTREGKPYCPEHVDQHPYVQAILGILQQREDEENLVRRRGSAAVDPGGLTAKELVLHLSLHGSRTVERLSREFQLETRVMQGYVNALKVQGVLVTGRTTRGSTVVRLAG